MDKSFNNYQKLRRDIKSQFFFHRMLNLVLMGLMLSVNLVLLIKGATGLAQGFYVFITIPSCIYLFCQFGEYNMHEKLALYELEESFK